MFDNASKKLKKPKVTCHRFRIERDNDGSVAARSCQTYCGTVSVDGKFYPTRDASEEVIEDIRKLSYGDFSYDIINRAEN